MIVFTKHTINKLVILSGFLSLNFFSWAQSGGAIVKTHPFYFVSIRGNFPMQGNEEAISDKTDTTKTQRFIIDTFIIVYVETRSKLIEWDKAWQKNKAYQLTALPISQIPFNAGFAKGGNTVVIAPAKGNFLWQLQLSPTGSLRSRQGKMTMDAILLNGSYKGRKFAWKTARLREIIPLPPA